MEQEDSLPPGVMWRGRLIKAAGSLAVALGLSAMAFTGGFVAFGYHVGSLHAPPQIDGADGIVVLTGGKQRIAAAIDLLRHGKAKRLLISGVNPVTDTAALQAANGASPALFSCCVDIDRAALDTIGNAAESAKWLRDRGYASAIVATSNYHIPRSLLELRRAVDGVDLRPYPVVNTVEGRFDWFSDAEARRVLFTEYAKYVGAMLRGVVDVKGGVAEARMAGR